MYMIYKHTNARLFCDARPRLHVIRNDVEKATLDRNTESVFTSQAWPWRSLGHTSQTRRAFVFMKHILFKMFHKWPIVSLDKTLIHRLVSFIALWSCTETIILTVNRLESIEVHYMEIIRGMFSSKTLIPFRLKKEIHTHLGWHGGE